VKKNLGSEQYPPTILSMVHSPKSIKKKLLKLSLPFFFFFFSCITHNLYFRKYYLNRIVIVDSETGEGAGSALKK
jgi:hypothetical protein